MGYILLCSAASLSENSPALLPMHATTVSGENSAELLILAQLGTGHYLWPGGGAASNDFLGKHIRVPHGAQKFFWKG